MFYIKKFKVLILSILLSLNLQVSSVSAFAPPVISAPVFGLLTTFAVGMGVVFNSVSEQNNFVNKYTSNKLLYEELSELINNELSIGSDNLATINGTLADFLYNSIQKVIDDPTVKVGELEINKYYDIPNTNNDHIENANSNHISVSLPGTFYFLMGVEATAVDEVRALVQTWYGNTYVGYFHNGKSVGYQIQRIGHSSIQTKLRLVSDNGDIRVQVIGGTMTFTDSRPLLHELPIISNPGTSAIYPRSIDTSTDVVIGIPGNSGSLVGGNVDVFNPNYGLTNGTDFVVPGVSNPSIELDTTIPFPNVSEKDDVIVPPVETVPPLEEIPPVDPPNWDIIWGGDLDLSPITNSNLFGKFPFSLASDIENLILSMNGASSNSDNSLVFNIDLLGTNLVLDFNIFNDLFSIIRFFVYLLFVYGLILLTRVVLL